MTPLTLTCRPFDKVSASNDVGFLPFAFDRGGAVEDDDEEVLELVDEVLVDAEMDWGREATSMPGDLDDEPSSANARPSSLGPGRSLVGS